MIQYVDYQSVSRDVKNIAWSR